MPCSHQFPRSRSCPECILLSCCQNKSLDHVPKQKDTMKLQAINGSSMWPSERGRCCILKAEEIILELDRKEFDLDLVLGFVKKNLEKLLLLPGETGWYIRICDLDSTIYMGQHYMLQSWQKLYLPQPIRMQVVGTLESSASMPPFPQWVVLAGEDGRVYAYGNEELTLVADTLKRLLQSGPNFSLLTYSYPDDVSDEDEEALQKDPEIQKIRKSTDDFIEESAGDFDDFLDFFDS